MEVGPITYRYGIFTSPQALPAGLTVVVVVAMVSSKDYSAHSTRLTPTNGARRASTVDKTSPTILHDGSL